MVTTAVQFDLDAEAARLFREANADERRRITVLFSALITAQAKHPTSLSAVMDELSDRAAERGLTEEKLGILLHEA